jgi:hypothetical protein
MEDGYVPVQTAVELEVQPNATQEQVSEGSAICHIAK